MSQNRLSLELPGDSEAHVLLTRHNTEESYDSDFLDGQDVEDEETLLDHTGLNTPGYVGVAGRPSSIANLSNTILGNRKGLVLLVC